jgi:hypothetical protein
MWQVYKKILDMNQRRYMIVDENMSSRGILERKMVSFSLIIKRDVQ